MGASVSSQFETLVVRRDIPGAILLYEKNQEVSVVV
jgi:hypothetical protein